MINKTARAAQYHAATHREPGDVDPQTRLDELRNELAGVRRDIKFCDGGKSIPQLGCMSEQHWAKCIANIDIALADLQLAIYELRRGD